MNAFSVSKLARRLLPLCLALALLLPALQLAYADTTYIVQPGDTLNKIAIKFNVSIQALMSANGLTNANLIYVGQRLIIPGVAGVSTAAPVNTGGTIYVVQAGDTLNKISIRFNVSIQAILTANNLTNLNLIYVGQRLIIPGASGLPVPTVQPSAVATLVPTLPAGGTYVVKSGDTLIKIAQRFGVTAQAILTANHLANANLIYIGQQLIIPGAMVTVTPTPTATPIRSATPLPTATAVAAATATNIPPSTNTSRGVRGEAFWFEATTVTVNQEAWFNFKAVNTTANNVSYAVLAAHVDSGPNAQSWTNETLKANETLIWRDHMHFTARGTYQVYLGICYDNKDACLANQRTWDRLSPSVTVTVQ